MQLSEPSEPDEALELRVHGVGGSTPKKLLDDPADPSQIGGNTIAGFFRRSDGRADVEGYSWGGLTSRAGARAFWVLLLPFALVNLAGWMLPQGSARSGWRSSSLRGLVRLAGFAITLLYVLWVALITLDLVAYQCGGDTLCYQGRWWLAFFDNPFFVDHVGRRLVLGALIPVALVGGFAYLGAKTRSRYEAYGERETDTGEFEKTPRRDRRPQATEDRSEGEPPLAGLHDPDFWHQTQTPARLGRLHIGVSLAIVALVVARAVESLHEPLRSAGADPRYLTLLALGGSVLVLAAAAVSILSLRHVGRSTSTTVMVAGLVVLVVALLDATAMTRVPTGPPGLPGIGDISLYVVGSTVGVVALLSLSLWASIRSSGLALGGLGAAVSSIIAAMFTIAFYSGLAIRIANLLGDPPGPGRDSTQALIVYPRAYDWVAVWIAAILFVTALVAAALYAWLWFFKPVPDVDAAQRTNVDPASHRVVRGYRGRRLGIDRSYDGEPSEAKTFRTLTPGHRKWLTGIARAQATSKAVDSAGVLLAVMAGAALLAGLGNFGIRCVVSGDCFGDLPVLPAGWWSWSYTLAIWTLNLLPIAAMLYMRRALREPLAGRKIGMIWDVATFWPRWYHPFAPPSYAERAVPELEMRVRQLTQPPNSRGVVLSGHGQGSVLAMAVLLRLPDRHLRRIALVTHGSPLTRLYARFFPAYFGELQFTGAALRLQEGSETRWRNLYRDTDPIGGAIHFRTASLGSEVNRRQPDPRARRGPMGEPWPPVMAHFEYDKDLEYLEVVRHFRRSLAN